MKKNVFLSLLIILSIFFACDKEKDTEEIIQSSGSVRTIHIKVPGSLQENLGNDYFQIEKLTITGKINGYDVHTIRNLFDLSFLNSLDLTNCDIVSGGQYKIEEKVYATKENTLPQRMFFKVSQLKEIKLPNSITKIDDGAFGQCVFESFVIPENIIKIGDEVFKDCNKLVSVQLPNNISYIGKFVFSGCESLTSVKIPNDVSIIEDGFFNGCISLTSIDLPEGITIIGDYAFAGSALISINIPEGVTKIGDHAFSGCYSIEKISLPVTLNIIGKNAFSFCLKLKTVTLKSSLITIGKEAFMFCRSLEEFNISSEQSSIEEREYSIGERAFSQCYLLESIIFPKGLKVINDQTFQYCHQLKDIILPESLTHIGREVFTECRQLTSITIPKHVEFIGEYAFLLATITDFKIKSIKPINIPREPINKPNSSDYLSAEYYDYLGFYRQEVNLFIPNGSRELYMNDEGWKDFKDYIEE